MAAFEYLPKKQQKINKIMEKERKITAPEGCEIEKVEIVDGAAVVTFREKEWKLPKSWEEFCEMFPDYTGEYFIKPNNIDKIGQVMDISKWGKRTDRNAELLPDRATAEAVLALCQLIQLRNAYNGDWVPDWTDEERKYTIDFDEYEIWCGDCVNTPEILYFRSKELRDEFMLNFRLLIEKLKPLYGFREGGEE